MKPAYVADLAPDTSVTTFLLVGEKELRATREGKPFLRLELSDRTGTIEARVWENVEYVVAAFDRDDIVKLQARVESYRNKTQLAIDKIRRAEPAEIDLADYFPHTTEDVDKLYLRLCAHAAAVATPWLNRLLTSMIEDPAIVPRLKRAPAAKMMHHAFLGGLLEHMVSLCDLCRVVAGHYRELDSDLLITGAILHDIGKLDELCYERAISYTTEGQLLGHIILELEQVTKKMDSIEGFPPDLKTLIKHLLISHHGQYEFGSPKLPMFREALVLHYLDDLDSKMAAARAVLGVTGGDKEWTGYSSALNRRLLRLDLFRPREPEVGAQVVSPCVPAQQELGLDLTGSATSPKAAATDPSEAAEKPGDKN
jgi:3'-5' exoribonuclease